MLAGLTIFAYVAAILVEGIAGGVFTGALAERRRRRTIEQLSGHYIICGYGRVGRRVAAEFRESGTDVRRARLQQGSDRRGARSAGDLFIEGTGTEDEDLEEAGLERARGLVASSDSDADNLYITLSARAARPDLLIVARASDEDAAEEAAARGRRPRRSAVLDGRQGDGEARAQARRWPRSSTSSRRSGGPDLRFEEIEVKETCDHAGKSIRELQVRQVTGAMIVALRKRDGTFDTTPTPEALLDVGDVMIAAGTPEELRRLEELFAPREALAS